VAGCGTTWFFGPFSCCAIIIIIILKEKNGGLLKIKKVSKSFKTQFETL
jgi:hypothetical protein